MGMLNTSPLRAVFVSLLIALIGAFAATAAGYGPFVDLLKPNDIVTSAPAPTVGTQLAASAKPKAEVAPASKSATSCKFCNKPCLSCPAPPADADISVELSLTNAAYNEQPGADLSRLQFAVAARWPGYRSEQAIAVASTRDIPRQKLELGLCTVQVEPLFSPAFLTAGRATSLREWTTKGAFKLTLRDDAGVLMDERIIGPAEAKPALPKEYTPLDVSRGEFAGTRRDIFEGVVKDFRSVEPLFSYEVIAGVNDRHTALDPAGNRFSYIFPRVSVKLYPRELMLARRAERLAQRQVRYGWWEQKKKSGSTGRDDGWGYAELPSFPSGGCGS